MDKIDIRKWQSNHGETEIHVYRWNDGRQEWLFGLNVKYAKRADFIEVMKIFKLEYDYEFLNEL